MLSKQETKLPESNTTIAEETDNSDFLNELAFNEQWEDTPIWIRGNDKNGYFATIGMHIISPTMEFPHDIRQLIKNVDWKLLLNIITFMTKTVANELFKEITIADLSKIKAQTMEE